MPDLPDLRLANGDIDSSFEELLRIVNCTSVHLRSLQRLITEMFKVKAEIAPELMKNVFEYVDIPHNLRNQSKCNRSIPNKSRVRKNCPCKIRKLCVKHVGYI